MKILTIDVENEAGTMRLAADLALAAKPGDLITLEGQLGAGKSVFARAFIQALAGEVEVPSPTYLLMVDYLSREQIPIRHADFYRLSDGEEIFELGFHEDSDAAISLVEWPQNAVPHLPEAAMKISIEIGEDDHRTLKIECAADAEKRFERSIAIRRFLDCAGKSDVKRVPFAADASSRRYEWIGEGEETCILMDAPKMPDGPIVRDGKPYSQIAHLAEEVAPFVAISNGLRSAGFCAPEIFYADEDAGLVLLEYLGDGKILDASGKPDLDRYCEAARVLADIHRVDWQEADFNGYKLPTYDEGAMAIEVSLLPDWYLAWCGKDTRAAREEFTEIWRGLAHQTQDFEHSIVLRDMHSPNVIWRNSEDRKQRVGLIDFQDALIGPAAYDVVSLAQDARISISKEQEAAILASYIEARQQHDASFDGDRFAVEYALMGALRNTKILGIFVRLFKRDGKPDYLPLLGGVRDYLDRNLQHPSLATYRIWVETYLGNGEADGQ